MSEKYKENLPPVTMQQAAELAGFSLDHRSNTTKADCPFCGGRKKLYITVSDSRFKDGLAHCMKCGETLSPIRMYAYAIGESDIKEAAKAWYNQNRCSSAASGKAAAKKLEPKAVDYTRIDVDPAPLSVRDRTYKAMLSLLSLQREHYENLRKRGLSDTAIKKAKYRSIPESRRNIDLMVQTLLQNGYILKGVPGFYKDEHNKWTLNVFGSGILIPQRNGLGQIQGFQIRRDTSDKSKRYIALSSREKKEGSPAQTFCHLAIGKRGISDIILTEGGLKADVISCLTGYSVLSVPGVNSLRFLPRALSDLSDAGLEQVDIAYDMDIRENKAVQKAEEQLIRILEKASIPYSILYWDEEYKGLDDWLAAKKRK